VTAPATDDWNQAYARLNAYLAAHRLGDLAHRHALVGRMIEQARARHAAEPGTPPVTITMQIAMDELDAWLAQAVPLDFQVSPGRRAAAARVALLLCDAAERWPAALLAEEVPPEMASQARGAAVRAGPDLAISRMIAREMDYGALETARETLERFEWAPILRAFLLWSAIWVSAYLIYVHYWR
jgi:hypothetical protein